jgi:engulfment and cell motility protein 1
LDGLQQLKGLIGESNGNTLAYGLTAFSKILQVPDVRADAFAAVDDWLVGRVQSLFSPFLWMLTSVQIIDLVVSHPLVNILRPATLILVILVTHRDPSNPLAPQIPALAPVVAQQPDLAKVLVSRLTAADYALCANSLMLINAISRDAMKTDFKEWARYIRIIYSFGANRNVSVRTMSSTSNVSLIRYRS